MILKKDCKYDIMTVTSMGIRITPVNRQPVNVSTLYEMQATSAESNVLNISSALGLKAKVLTKFVKDSPIALFIKGELRKRNIEFEGIDIEQGDPWSYRHQFNIADSGYGVRGPRVLNDRAGEVGRTLSADDFDLERLFEKEGCRILHLSGLIAALSENTSKCCLDIALAAKKYGTAISFDLNYRASFWKGREKQLREIFTKIASISDILIGNEEDFQLALGIEGPEAGGKAISKTDAFKDMITRTSAQFKNVRVFANTLRQVENANSHLWGAIIYAEDNWYAVEPREIPVLDRIGGGDGFVGGLLYGILKEWEPEKWVQFGWASGALVTTLMTDYGQPADEEVIWSIYKGNARVKR